MKKILTEWRKFLGESQEITDKAVSLVPKVLDSLQAEWREMLVGKIMTLRNPKHRASAGAYSGLGTALVDSAIMGFLEEHLFAQPNNKQSLFNWYDEHSGKWWDGGGGSRHMKYDVHRAVKKSQPWLDWVESQNVWKTFLNEALDGTMDARLKKQGVKGDIVGKLFSSPKNFWDIARLVDHFLKYNLGDI